MKKLIITALVVIVSSLSVSCVEVEERRCTAETPCYHDDQIEPEALSVVGEVYFDLERENTAIPTFYNDSPVKRLPVNFYVEETELLLHDWIFEVSIGTHDVIDWEKTVIRLNDEELNPEIEILESSDGEYVSSATVKVTWRKKSYRSLYGENKIEMDFVFTADVPSYCGLSLFTKAVLLKELGTEDYYLGHRDVDLGKEAFSGVLGSEEEQHAVGGFPMLLMME